MDRLTESVRSKVNRIIATRRSALVISSGILACLILLTLPDIVWGQGAAIDIQKTPDTQQVRVGSTATFDIRVENTGGVALAAVTVSDSLATDCERTFATLAVGEVKTYQCTATVAEDFTNTANVSGNDPSGAPVQDSDTAIVDAISPGVDIQKTPDTQQLPVGSTATFGTRVENTGDVALTTVTVWAAGSNSAKTNVTKRCRAGPLQTSVFRRTTAPTAVASVRMACCTSAHR